MGLLVCRSKLGFLAIQVKPNHILKLHKSWIPAHCRRRVWVYMVPCFDGWIKHFTYMSTSTGYLVCKLSCSWLILCFTLTWTTSRWIITSFTKSLRSTFLLMTKSHTFSENTISSSAFSSLRTKLTDAVHDS